MVPVLGVSLMRQAGLPGFLFSSTTQFAVSPYGVSPAGAGAELVGVGLAVGGLAGPVPATSAITPATKAMTTSTAASSSLGRTRDGGTGRSGQSTNRCHFSRSGQNTPTVTV